MKMREKQTLHFQCFNAGFSQAKKRVCMVLHPKTNQMPMGPRSFPQPVCLGVLPPFPVALMLLCSTPFPQKCQTWLTLQCILHDSKHQDLPPPPPLVKWKVYGFSTYL